MTLTAHLLTCQGEEYVEHFLHCTHKTWVPGAQSKDSFPFTLIGQFNSILSEPIQQLGVNLIQFFKVQVQQTNSHLTLLMPLTLNYVQNVAQICTKEYVQTDVHDDRFLKSERIIVRQNDVVKYVTEAITLIIITAIGGEWVRAHKAGKTLETPWKECGIFFDVSRIL